MRDDLADGLDARSTSASIACATSPRPERVFQLTVAGLPTRRFRPLQSLDAYPGNLPSSITSFVGRDDELDGGRRRARARHGSSRSPASVASARPASRSRSRPRCLREYPDGAWLCELAPATRRRGGRRGGRGDARRHAASGDAVARGEHRRLPAHEALLLVLDNCEHLLDAAARLAERDHAQACPTCASSRPAAKGSAVDGRADPAAALAAGARRRARSTTLAPSDAARLFVERAAAADRASRSTMPAARGRGDLPPSRRHPARHRARGRADVEHDEPGRDRRRCSTSGSGCSPAAAAPRSSATRRSAPTVDWSYSLLTDTERAVFDRLGVFSGTFDLDAVEAVVVDDDGSRRGTCATRSPVSSRSRCS